MEERGEETRKVGFSCGGIEGGEGGLGGIKMYSNSLINK